MSALAEPREKKANIWGRDRLDWYAEPSVATAYLLRVERFVGPTLDPCCGGGNIVRAFADAGLECVGTDIVRRAGALNFIEDVDFLDVGSISQTNICMNPPFFKAKGAEAFILHALKLAKGKVAAFVDIKFLAGSKRANGLFAEHCPHRIWIITPRVSCPPGEYLAAGNKAGGGTADWCWALWDLTAPKVSTAQLGWLRLKSE